MNDYTELDKQKSEVSKKKKEKKMNKYAVTASEIVCSLIFLFFTFCGAFFVFPFVADVILKKIIWMDCATLGVVVIVIIMLCLLAEHFHVQIFWGH